MKHPTSSTCQSCVAVSCQQPWVRWELREKKWKQAETEWKKGCRQHLYSAVLWPPKSPWKVFGGTKLLSLRCLWIRGVDRRDSSQQGCSTESGWRYAGAFGRTERKVGGKDFHAHKSRGTVEKPCPAGWLFQVSLRGLPSVPSQTHDKRLSFPPPDNKRFCCPWITGVVFTREMQVHVLL